MKIPNISNNVGDFVMVPVVGLLAFGPLAQIVVATSF